MRWIFISLVVVNLLVFLFFWQQQNDVLEPAVSSVNIPKSSQSIRLLSEAERVLEQAPAAAPLAHKRSELCYSAGPYSERELAQNLLARASKLGFSTQLNEMEISTDEPAQYWVIVPPRRSRDEAMRTLRELQLQHIDSYIITQGEQAEGVSIGLFRNKSSAEALSAQLNSLSIPVEVRVLNKNIKEYWVEINETSQLNASLREKILAEDENSSWQLINCTKNK